MAGESASMIRDRGSASHQYDRRQPRRPWSAVSGLWDWEHADLFVITDGRRFHAAVPGGFAYWHVLGHFLLLLWSLSHLIHETGSKPIHYR